MKLTFSIIIAAVFSFSPVIGFPQIGCTLQSVEWLTASSDVVIQAVVKDWDTLDPTSTPEDRKTFSDPVVVTLKVVNCIKGRSGETVKITVESVDADETLTPWKKSGQHIIWFLKTAKDSDADTRQEPRDDSTT